MKITGIQIEGCIGESGVSAIEIVTDGEDGKLYFTDFLVEEMENVYVTKESVYEQAEEDDFDPEDLVDRAVYSCSWDCDDDDGDFEDTPYPQVMQLLHGTSRAFAASGYELDREGAEIVKSFVGRKVQELDISPLQELISRSQEM